MFYICKKNSQDKTFGVMDTEDGVVEYYTPKEIGRFITKLKVEIEGADIIGGKLHLTVKKPIEFEDTSETNTNIEFTDPFVKIGTPSSFDSIDEDDDVFWKDFSSRFMSYSMILVKIMNILAGRDTGLRAGDFNYLDGADCIGFEYVTSSLNPRYKVSAYTCPDIKIRETEDSCELLDLIVSGFGIDVKDTKDGNMEHIDCDVKSYMKDIVNSKGWDLLNV